MGAPQPAPDSWIPWHSSRMAGTPPERMERAAGCAAREGVSAFSAHSRTDSRRNLPTNEPPNEQNCLEQHRVVQPKPALARQRQRFRHPETPGNRRHRRTPGDHYHPANAAAKPRVARGVGWGTGTGTPPTAPTAPRLRTPIKEPSPSSNSRRPRLHTTRRIRRRRRPEDSRPPEPPAANRCRGSPPARSAPPASPADPTRSLRLEPPEPSQRRQPRTGRGDNRRRPPTTAAGPPPRVAPAARSRRPAPPNPPAGNEPPGPPPPGPSQPPSEATNSAYAAAESSPCPAASGSASRSRTSQPSP